MLLDPQIFWGFRFIIYIHIMKDFICDWCNELRERYEHSSTNKSGNYFCNRTCKEAYRRGYNIDIKLKTELLRLKELGFTVKQIVKMMNISQETYYRALKI